MKNVYHIIRKKSLIDLELMDSFVIGTFDIDSRHKVDSIMFYYEDEIDNVIDYPVWRKINNRIKDEI